MKVVGLEGLREVLATFEEYACIIVIRKYNGGKSSVITNLLCEYYGDEKARYVTFIDQSKPQFKPRKSTLEFGEHVQGEVIIIDELSDDKGRNIHAYVKKLLQGNKVIILTNPYGSSENENTETYLLKEHEKEWLPEKTLCLLVV